jgi:chromosome segregation ATPase
MSDASESTLRERFIAANVHLEAASAKAKELEEREKELRATLAPWTAEQVEVKRRIEVAIQSAQVDELASLLPRRDALVLVCEAVKARIASEAEVLREPYEREIAKATAARNDLYYEIADIHRKLPPIEARIAQLKKEGADYMPMHVNQRKLAPIEAELARLNAILKSLDDCPPGYWTGRQYLPLS